ncbi:MAG: hypothetical protein CMJ16_10300 [Peredibacter sp.]|nr:hypothetical protein [Peredibacter sp.]
MKAKLKHDFTNNCLRLEILHKIILESLDKGEGIKEQLADYGEFLDYQKELIKNILDENQV